MWRWNYFVLYGLYVMEVWWNKYFTVKQVLYGETNILRWTKHTKINYLGPKILLDTINQEHAEEEFVFYCTTEYYLKQTRITTEYYLKQTLTHPNLS